MLRVETEGHGDEEGVHPRSEKEILGRVNETHPLHTGCSVGTQQGGAFMRRHCEFAELEGVTDVDRRVKVWSELDEDRVVFVDPGMREGVDCARSVIGNTL